MSQIEKNCKNYTNFEKIGIGSSGKVYKALNKQTNSYVAIKEIDKNNYIINEVEKMNIIKSENIVKFKSKIDSKDYFYIIMDLCINNLENYIKSRENDITIKEIKEILNQLNNVFKIMNNNKIIHKDLKPRKILISLDRLDKCLIKLSGSNKNINLSNTITNTTNQNLTTAPEILNGENHSFKSDIWSLGIIIYFMLNKEYPFNGQNELLLFKDINSGKKLKLSNDDKLNDLLNKMLKININERISWEEYFNHPFFNQDNSELFKVNSDDKHLKQNICENYIEEHSTHNIIPFNKIGLNNNKNKRIENLYKEIENKLNKKKKDIEDLLLKMESIKENKLIYENDIDNNYKEYYIKYLENINKLLDNNEIQLIDLTVPKFQKSKNEIIGFYDTKKGKKTLFEDEKDDYLNNPIRILNCYEETKKDNKYLKEGINNEKEINENCELYLNGNKMDFCYEFKFVKEGNYTIKIIIKQPLLHINYIFYDCNKLISIDLSNFNSSEVTNMEYMFYECSSLNSLNLSNFITNKVTNMEYMFYECSSLTSLNLSNFNTDNVTNMRNMFYGCSSLTSLNLSKFKTNNVTNMEYMFCYCSSLTSLILSNFITNKVTNMGYMFYKCSSLTSLNLSNFNTENVTNMGSMFYGCSSLTSLNLSDFNTNNVNNMRSQFSYCSNLTSLNLSNFIINNITDMRSIFFGLNKNCKIICNNEKIKRIKF